VSQKSFERYVGIALNIILIFKLTDTFRNREQMWYVRLCTSADLFTYSLSFVCLLGQTFKAKNHCSVSYN